VFKWSLEDRYNFMRSSRGAFYMQCKVDIFFKLATSSLCIYQVMERWEQKKMVQTVRHRRWTTPSGYSCILVCQLCLSCNNAVLVLWLRAEIAQWYSAELRARWSGVRVPTGAGNVSLHHRVQNGSGAHPASYPMGTRGPFPVGKAAGTWS
jgi:hypothetical protein